MSLSLITKTALLCANPDSSTVKVSLNLLPVKINFSFSTLKSLALVRYF